ncbi:MAG TPA: hypothetical protein VFV41_15065 [Streptosporangiaceae bacterium]|nr:hypothetical protein [Streptosporangiaceae bacterium]
MAQVTEEDVLLMWRALRAFRSGARPACQPRGRPRHSPCPFHGSCPRWRGRVDDRAAIMEETLEQTDARRSAWPCSRILDLLTPEVRRISPG